MYLPLFEGAFVTLKRAVCLMALKAISMDTPCIMYVQYRGGCSVPWGDIMSTVGGYLEYRGGYHEYHGGLS